MRQFFARKPNDRNLELIRLSSDENEGESSKHLSLLRARIFLEDAYKYRSIFHKLDPFSLRLYEIYHSRIIRITRFIVLTCLLLLAFFEYPSSWNVHADITVDDERRNNPPCGATQTLEFLLLLFIAAEVSTKCYLFGFRNLLNNPWVIGEICAIGISFIDWFVTIGTICREFIRVRRYVRPYFVVANSSFMKKIIKSLNKTIPEVASVMLLLLILMLFFSVLLVTLCIGSTYNVTDATSHQTCNFVSFYDTFFQILVLLTTANHPDVMVPMYTSNRFYSLLFIIFMLLAFCLLMNVVVGVVFNQLRGYLQTSFESSNFRRHVALRAAFEVLRSYSDSHVEVEASGEGVQSNLLEEIVTKSHFNSVKKAKILQRVKQMSHQPLHLPDYRKIMTVLDEARPSNKPPYRTVPTSQPYRIVHQIVRSPVFEALGILVAAVNFILILVFLSLGKKYHQDFVIELSAMNIGFLVFYVMEQILRVWACGLRAYFFRIHNVVDLLIVLIVLVSRLIQSLFFQRNLDSGLWTVSHALNLLVMLRCLRAATYFNSMRIVLVTLWDIICYLPPLLGIFMLAFHNYALLGLQLMADKINISEIARLNSTMECGTYSQLGYWPINFNDYASALMVLWDLMIVNNWFIIVESFRKAMDSYWIHIYFISWWLIAPVILLNVFVAFIIEIFLFRRDRYYKAHSNGVMRSHSVWSQGFSFYELFAMTLEPPTEEKILSLLKKHKELCRIVPQLVMPQSLQSMPIIGPNTSGGIQ